MTPTATGRIDEHEPGWVVFHRTFTAPVEAVWAAVTEPVRLERWIGTWSGDPASGRVDFQMTAEGADAPAEACTIDACDVPRLLRLSIATGGQEWQLRLELTEADGVTTLAFAQRMSDPELASSVGPGWDYYLDRLVAAETGEDPATVDWDAYFPALADHYRTLLTP